MYTTFHYIHYISQRSNAKNCFRITGLQRHDSKPSADNNTRYSPSKSITECVKFLWPHTPYGRVRLVRFARARLFTDFFTDFKKKTDCFAVYHCVVGISKRKLKQKVAEIKVRGIECVLNCIILVCTM